MAAFSWDSISSFPNEFLVGYFQRKNLPTRDAGKFGQSHRVLKITVGPVLGTILFTTIQKLAIIIFFTTDYD